MRRREKNTSARLRRAAILSISACLAVSAWSILLAQNAPTIETVVTLPAEPNGRTENISEGPDDAIYVTAPIDRIVWKIKDGKATKFYTAPAGFEIVSGVAGNSDELAMNVVTHSPFTVGADGQTLTRNPNPMDATSQLVVVDKSGKVKTTVVGSDPKLFWNGLARAGNDWYLATGGTAVVSIDTKTKMTERWFEDPMVRTNGIKVHNGWVYLTSTDKVYRVRIGADRKPMGGAVLFATAAQTDDFAVAPDGTLYIPSGKRMMKVTPSGETSVFMEDMGTENLAAAWATMDGKWLYWPARMGPAKVSRVALK